MSNAVAAPQSHVNRAFILKVSLIAGLGGILYGYDMGIIAAALIFVRTSFALSTQMEEIPAPDHTQSLHIAARSAGASASHDVLIRRTTA